ncbi:MAG: hypothetical protein HY831_02955 [Candidatus Aenigmarchaeota archaeon]|nr:hypothetical protein [Candidatus Aenigmarchaeota archaeon]
MKRLVFGSMGSVPLSGNRVVWDTDVDQLDVERRAISRPDIHTGYLPDNGDYGRGYQELSRRNGVAYTKEPRDREYVSSMESRLASLRVDGRPKDNSRLGLFRERLSLDDQEPLDNLYVQQAPELYQKFLESVLAGLKQRYSIKIDTSGSSMLKDLESLFADANDLFECYGFSSTRDNGTFIFHPVSKSKPVSYNLDKNKDVSNQSTALTAVLGDLYESHDYARLQEAILKGLDLGDVIEVKLSTQNKRDVKGSEITRYTDFLRKGLLNGNPSYPLVIEPVGKSIKISRKPQLIEVRLAPYARLGGVPGNGVPKKRQEVIETRREEYDTADRGDSEDTTRTEYC